MSDMTRRQAKWVLGVSLLIIYATICWIIPLTNGDYWDHVKTIHIASGFCLGFGGAIILSGFAIMRLMDR
jgi:hypothetical protein